MKDFASPPSPRQCVAQLGTRSRGFTLLELLVVVAILGLLAAYAGPRFFAQLGRSAATTGALPSELHPSKTGAGSVNRTRAIRITSAALYLLSYPGKNLKRQREF